MEQVRLYTVDRFNGGKANGFNLKL